MDIKEIKTGLMASPKYIPFWYRYDKAGSIFNEKCIKENKYYYFHREEETLLRNHVQDIIQQFENEISVIDLGSGKSEKTRIILDALLGKQQSVLYVPVDISKEFLKETCRELQEHYGDALQIDPVCDDYKVGMQRCKTIDDNVLVVWFGALNFSFEDITNKMTKMRECLKDGDILLLSVDFSEDKNEIENAYLDPNGISALLHLNAINRLNEEFHGDLDLQHFELEREFVLCKEDDRPSFVKVWLRALSDFSCKIDGLGLTLDFKEGEKLYLHSGDGVSYKYNESQLRNILRRSSLNLIQMLRFGHVVFALLHK